jgi:hypothetical protein
MEKRKEKTPGQRERSIAPATSLTYALRGYKVVIESQQDAKLLQTARGVWGKQRLRGGEYGSQISSTQYMNKNATRRPSIAVEWALKGYIHRP